MVAVVLGSVVALLAYTFYRNMMGNLERQKRVSSLQDGVRTAVDCINRYLIAGGVSGDSIFYDPHRLLPLPLVRGGHRIFHATPDSTQLTVYGNFSGGAAQVDLPVLERSHRRVRVDKPSLFRAGGYAYISAGSAQEVARVTAVNGPHLVVANDFFATYPKGTLVVPLERIRIARRPGAAVLEVYRETAGGQPIFPRTFVPTQRPGDSLDFRVRSLDHGTGQIGYALTFAANASGRKALKLVRRSEQTVFVRGY
jgi:hypothetical protein